ncbi:MAG: large-conductance mechanosensitive channel protein MscL [Rhodanobacteraceae bacterium]
MSFASDFKAFVMRGNVIDMAVGIVIGAAFGRVVSSLVSDIIMPPLGAITGGIDFSKMEVIIKNSPDPKKVVAITYGQFINTVISFIIIALAIFLVIRLIEKLHPKKPAAAPPTPPEVALLTEIRDVLKQQSH